MNENSNIKIINNLFSGFAGLKEHWKDDLKAGFNISLIALPLSLGIALASGFPPVAGLFAAIIGGMFVSRINGSFVTIVGPAAGLIVVNIGAIEMLGQGDNAAGYRYALAAIFVAGIVIALFGFLKAGKFGDFFPASAVHGMLAAIGIIIITKQFFVAVAVRAHGHEFYEILEEIPIALRHANPEVALISVLSLLILIFHPKIKSSVIQAVPAPIWVLLVAIPLEFLMDFEHTHEVIFLGEHHKVGPQLLVHLPANIADGFVFPDFGKIATGAFWIAVTTIALVTALESLLSALAVDSLDPMRRKTNLDKDLKALGAGSGLSGLIGGLPMISEIVRSSANVSSGAKTQWSNFFHGGFLLIFLLVGGPVIDHIPLSALAAMLLFTGYRLASPREFKSVYQTGKSELLVFVSTIIMVLMTDLIIGVCIGILMNLIVNLFKGTRFGNLFRVRMKKEINGTEVIFHLSESLIFSNYLGLKRQIIKHSNQGVKLDLGGVHLIDHSVMHHLHKLETEFLSRERGFAVVNDHHLISSSEHPLAGRKRGKHQESREETLNSRQNKLARLAAKGGWNFQYEKTVAFQEFTTFTFNKRGIIRYIQNTITGLIGGVSFKYTEIEFDEDIETKSSTEVIPALLLSPDTPLPHFTLEREGFLDKLAGLSGFNDIDFEAYPEFSDKFLLKGKDEVEVRQFFTESLIRLLENDPKYHLESDGRSLIIYRFDRKTDSHMVEGLLSLAEKLVSLLHTTKKRVSFSN